MLTTCTRWIEFARYVKYVSICDSLQTPAQVAAKDWVHMRLLPCCGGGTPRFQSLLVPFHGSHDFPLFGLQNSFLCFLMVIISIVLDSCTISISERFSQLYPHTSCGQHLFNWYQYFFDLDCGFAFFVAS